MLAGFARFALLQEQRLLGKDAGSVLSEKGVSEGGQLETQRPAHNRLSEIK